ncbi:hypothetical protein HMPREF1417_00331 [Helicobacter pylori GAM260Bi]|nr:hypothetical protein [Helicobacter pylori]EMH21581.1 hypothetical protein HMPREF1417_00331 [Helicobacter pylori GAM260Bi]EMH70637.1 hypothetical protein HMPREF1452_00951 [Helicobacter pylori HP260Bi]
MEKQKLSFYRNFVLQNYRFNKTTTLHPKNEILRYNVFQEFLPFLSFMANSLFKGYPHKATYGGVYFTIIFLKTKSQLN